MMLDADPRLVRRLELFTMAAASLAFTVGILAILGLTLHIPFLYTWGAAPLTMKVNSATCFVLAGCSLLLSRRQEDERPVSIQKFAATFLAFIVFSIGLASLVENASGWDFGIDQLLARDPRFIPSMAALRAGLMSPITAGAFLMLGLALAGIDWRTRCQGWPSQYFALAAAAGATFGILSFAFDPHLYASNLSLALPTAITLTILSLGVICSRTEWGLGARLCSRSLGGSLLRRLLPAAFIPVFVGWLRWKITLSGVVSDWSVVVLSAMLTMCLLAVVITWAAMAVDRNDVERRKIEAALHISQDQLNQLLGRVEEAPAETLLRRRVTLGFTGAVVLTGLMGFLSWHNANQAAEDADWVAHTHQVIATLEASSQHVSEMTTAGRGFALNGTPSLLTTYSESKNQIVQDVELLRQLTTDNWNQQRRINRLMQELKSTSELFDEQVVARQQKRTAPNAVQLAQSRALMESIQSTAEQIKAEEASLLSERTERTRNARRVTISVMAVTSVVGMFFLAIAGLVASRQIGATARARSQIIALNEDLEQRVSQRTADLAASERRLAGVIQSAMDAIITVDEQQAIVLFNSAAEKMFLCSAEEVMGKSLARFIPERFRAGHSQHIRRFGETGGTNRAMGTMSSLWAVRANGEEFQIEASISQVIEADKRMFTVILRDVTERMRAQEIQREHLQIMDLAQVLVRDMDDRIVRWNVGAQRLYGYTPEEALGRISHELLQTEFMQPLQDINTQLRRNDSWEGELIHRSRNGERVVIFSQWVLHRDAQGEPTLIFEANTDITARKRLEDQLLTQTTELVAQAEELSRTETALRERTVSLQSVLDNMGEGLVAADTNGKFLMWNKASNKILGLGQADIPVQEWPSHYGTYLSDQKTLFRHDDLPLVRGLRGEACDMEIFLRNKQRPEGAWIDISARPIVSEGNAITGAVAAFRDVTAAKAAEREIRKLNEELEQRVAQRTSQLEAANKELEAFSYSVSHDLRAPLRHMSGFSRILTEDFGALMPEEAQQLLHRIVEASNRMGMLVDELLNLSRVNRQNINLRKVSLSSIVNDVVTLLQPETKDREIEWRIAELPDAECDPVLIQQVFQNLITNAIKFTRIRRPAMIEIGLTQKDGHDAVFVRDNGVGFSMKYADKLFGVFQRLHRAEEFEGTGIGLATVQRIIKKHGGQIWVDAEVDRGATFYFTLNTIQTTTKQLEATAIGA